MNEAGQVNATILRPEVRLNSLFRSFARGGSVAVMVFGCLVLLGWIFDITALKTHFLGAFTIKANAAVGFSLAGAALWLALSGQADSRIHRLKQACAVVVAFIGLLTLCQYLFGWNLGIDQLMFKEPTGAFGTSNPSRMGPNTALNFLLIGLGLLLLDWKTRHGRHPAQFLIIPACVIALLALLGHLYGVEELFGIHNYTLMPIQAGLAFIVLCLAMLFAHTDAGLMAILSTYGTGGLLARRLLPAALIVPAILGWIGLLGERAGLYDTAFGMSLIAVMNIAFLSIMILTTTRSLNRADATRKQAEEALLKAGALQSAIFNSANFSSIATDAKGIIQIFNVGAERMLGYAATEVVNKVTPADLSDPLELIAHAKALSMELGTPIKPGFEALVFKASRGIEDIYELTKIRKDGSRFPAIVSVTALRDDQNIIIGYLLIGTDNSARKQVEAEQKKFDYTRSLIESNLDAIMTTDPSGAITDVNKQMEALTGCTRDELVGAPFKNYFTDPERAEACIKLTLSEKKITNYELTTRARDGKETVVSCNAAIFYDRDKTLRGVFATARDITEQKENESEIQRLNAGLRAHAAKLESANTEMESFAYSVSHDLRAPLRSMDGFSQALLEDYESRLDATGQDYLRRIRASAQRMGQLIDDLLNLSRVSRSEMELRPVDLAALARKVIAELQPQQAGRAVQWEVSDPLTAKGDTRLLQLVLENLLGNALKFTGKCVQAHIEFGQKAEGPERVFFVRDNGAGFDMAYANRLFGAFQRLHTTQEFPGIGIGLVTVQRIIHRHGGRVWAEAEPGKGATFYFTLQPIK